MIPRSAIIFAAVGVAATATHYTVMMSLATFTALLPPSQATMVGSVFGILVSFFGNRLLTFSGTRTPLIAAFTKFIGLYAAIALLHGGAMALGSERLGWNLTLVFIVATGAATALSYLGARFLVFRA